MLADRAGGFARDLAREVESTHRAPLNNALELRRKQAEAETLTPAGRGQKGDQAPDVQGKKKGADSKQPPPPIAPPGGAAQKLVGVEYAHPYAPGLYSDTLLWHPALWIADGSGEVRFDIGSGQTTYRVLLLGHSTTGRFGFFETRLDVLPVESPLLAK
jgi:hypothetical protein